MQSYVKTHHRINQRKRTRNTYRFHITDAALTAAVIFGCLGVIAVSAAFLLKMFNQTTQIP